MAERRRLPLFDLPLGIEETKDVEIRAGLDESILQNAPEIRTRQIDTAQSAEPDCAFAASHLLDKQERLFFWYRNHARHDCLVQGWKRGRFFADVTFTLLPDEASADDEFHKVFVTETKGLHLKRTTDTD